MEEILRRHLEAQKAYLKRIDDAEERINKLEKEHKIIAEEILILDEILRMSGRNWYILLPQILLSIEEGNIPQT